jgi:hypothetical protein
MLGLHAVSRKVGRNECRPRNQDGGRVSRRWGIIDHCPQGGAQVRGSTERRCGLGCVGGERRPVDRVRAGGEDAGASSFRRGGSRDDHARELPREARSKRRPGVILTWRRSYRIRTAAPARNGLS